MGFFDKIQAKIEIFRLEQRYTRRRHRRSTFVSNAIYVDGEYIYQTPNTTGSSSTSNNSSSTDDVSPTYESSSIGPTTTAATGTVSPKERKKMHRFSSMPGFGSAGTRGAVAPQPDWRTQRASFDGTR